MSSLEPKLLALVLSLVLLTAVSPSPELPPITKTFFFIAGVGLYLLLVLKPALPKWKKNDDTTDETASLMTRTRQRSASANRMRRRSLKGPLLFPPHDLNSPSFHFWTLVKKDNDVAGAMRNGGCYPPGGGICKASLISPTEEGADAGRPAAAGYKYSHADDTINGAKYGGWARLEDDCRARLVSDFMNADNIDRAMQRRKASKISLKNAAIAAIPKTEAAESTTSTIGGPSRQLPISIDEYYYYNLVQNRLPFSLELGFLITAKSEDNGKGDDWSGMVGHLDQQTFFWRRRHADMCTVQFTMKEWYTWEVDVEGLPGVRQVGDFMEFPTTHLWVDLDKYEMVWFHYDRAIARKTIYVPFFLKKPIDMGVRWGVKKSISGEDAEDE